MFKRHGGVEIDTPVFELKETLLGKQTRKDENVAMQAVGFTAAVVTNQGNTARKAGN